MPLRDATGPSLATGVTKDVTVLPPAGPRPPKTTCGASASAPEVVSREGGGGGEWRILTGSAVSPKEASAALAPVPLQVGIEVRDLTLLLAPCRVPGLATAVARPPPELRLLLEPSIIVSASDAPGIS